ncbi:hypothetical protein EVAR_13791_1 [Eumeta japonica]|uniref:Uncharacterized protein n=1 Tax=Eumeta variegata TaxID=151549 RepID=A0A4C1U100_EUMVA|nr:hypothetical protein EVAR_13791_1 [Eumeta japonica]
MVFAILNKTDNTKHIFKNLTKAFNLSDITIEASYKRGRPGQCHRYQKYGHVGKRPQRDPVGEDMGDKTAPEGRSGELLAGGDEKR